MMPDYVPESAKHFRKDCLYPVGCSGCKKPRIAYHADESFAEDTRHGLQYWVVKITESESGYERVAPFSKLSVAKSSATVRNVADGLSERDVLDIRLSSLKVSEIK